MKPRLSYVKGFTLIELMIVVVVIAILATIAVPSYSKYVVEARRADAVATLLELQSAQERWRVNNPAYNQDLTRTNDFYDFAVELGTADTNTYTLTATAKGSQTRDAGCLTLTIDQAGTKTPQDCWKK